MDLPPTHRYLVDGGKFSSHGIFTAPMDPTRIRNADGEVIYYLKEVGRFAQWLVTDSHGSRAGLIGIRSFKRAGQPKVRFAFQFWESSDRIKFKVDGLPDILAVGDFQGYDYSITRNGLFVSRITCDGVASSMSYAVDIAETETDTLAMLAVAFMVDRKTWFPSGEFRLNLG